jgi:hypothetical protein
MFEDDLSRIDAHIAEARRYVQRQRGLIIRFHAAGVGTWDAQRILWLLETNLRRLEEGQVWPNGQLPLETS